MHISYLICYFFFFFFKQKTAYEVSVRDWSSDVCSSDLEARVRPVAPTHLRQRFPLDPDDVCGEVEAALEQARPHAVHVHRHLLLFELPDLVDGEAARDDDLHVLEAFPVERPAHVPDELR